MIDNSDIIDLLSNKNADNVICRQFGLKPSNIAMFIAAMSNTSQKYGYIIIGVTKNETGYTINGISSSLKIGNIIQAAISKLDYQPIITHKMHTIENKNICVISVKKHANNVFIKSKEHIRKDKREELIHALYLACVKLQSNLMYTDVTEDQRNDFIRDLLETGGYQVKDQTRRGASNTGKSAGEVDLFIQNAGLPITIIEALNLKSLDTSYLDMHINKIYKYDTLGNSFNIVLSYVSIKDFENFWKKYCSHVKQHDYPYKLIDIDEQVDVEYNYSDIRVMVTKHNRNGKETLLYHMCVKMISNI